MMKEILKELKKTERSMRTTSAIMLDHKQKNKNIHKKGVELFGAAIIARDWIKEIEKLVDN